MKSFSLLLLLPMFTVTPAQAEVNESIHVSAPMLLTAEELMIKDFRDEASAALECIHKNPELKSLHDTLRNALSAKVTVDANQFIGELAEKHVIINHETQGDGSPTIVIHPTVWDPLDSKTKRRYAILTYANLVGLLGEDRKMILNELEHDGDHAKETPHAPNPLF